MEKHFTSSVYILRDGEVLLLMHPKLKKWLPPGGHIENNESPPEAGRREVLEEVGLEIDFIKQENVWVKHWNAESFERPFLCLSEDIPAHNDVPAHKHLDFTYLAHPVGDKEPEGPDPMRYFSPQEIEALESDVEIFAETKEVLQTIFNMEAPTL